MADRLIKRAVSALKNGDFQEKSQAYLLRRYQGIVKVVRKRFCKFDGDWYHGGTAEGYETIRLQQDWWHDENRVLSKFLTHIPDGTSVLDVPKRGVVCTRRTSGAVTGRRGGQNGPRLTGARRRKTVE